jgi:SAM-dependent methyltransferase
MVAFAPLIARRIRHESYLYPGFRAVVFLPSIRLQRELQVLLLDDRSIRSVIFAGCGFADEMACLLERGLGHARDLVAIDIADVEADVLEMATRAGRTVSFSECDLLDLETLPRSGSFDLLQAGFVFHDLTEDEKDEGYGVASRVLGKGGYFLVSDFFPGNVSPEALYRPFIEEAERETAAGRMPATARDAFLGDGECAGLLRTIAGAAAGERDFFDLPGEAIRRAARHGMRLVETRINDLNDTMRVLLFQKTSESPVRPIDVLCSI